MSRSLYSAVAAIFVPYALNAVSSDTGGDVEICRNAFMVTPEVVSQYFADSPLISYLNGIMMVLTFKEMNTILQTASNVCEILDKLPINMEELAVAQLNGIYHQKVALTGFMDDLYKHISLMYNYPKFVLYSTIIMVIFIVIYLISTCITLNTLMKNNQRAIDFLSSDERMATVIQDLEVRETVWEQLNDYASSSINVSDSSLVISQLHLESESELEIRQQGYSTPADSDISESEEKSARSKISITPSSFTGSALNINKQPKAFETDASKLVEFSETETENNTTSPRHDADISLIKEIVKTKSKSDRPYVVYSFLSVFMPWFLLYIFALLCYCPILIRRNNEQDKVKSLNVTDQHMTAAIKLLNTSYYQFYFGLSNISSYEEIESIFISEISDISKLYFKEECYTFNEYVCISISSIVHQMIDNEISELYLVQYAIPAIVAFTESSMTNVFSTNITNMRPILHSCGPCFCINFIIIIFIILIVRFVKNMLVRRGFNSLFHFPDFFAHKKTKKEVKEIVKKEKRFPTNILLVTSVTETDEIYSISDNSLPIINKSSSEMICRKLGKSFPVIGEKSGFQIRENNGKTFISRSLKVGRLTKTILIETTKIEMKSKGFNVQQKLSNFMPAYFAKSLSEDLVRSYHFGKSVLIFIRMEPKAGQLDKFFTCIDMQIQMYYNIEFIRSNGSVLTCICTDPNELEIFLFLRDVIKESENSCRGQKQNFALKSIFVSNIDELNFEIVEGSEPSARYEEEQFQQMETAIFEVDDHCVGGNEGTVMTHNCIERFTSVKKLNNGQNISLIPFNTYTNDFMKTL